MPDAGLRRFAAAPLAERAELAVLREDARRAAPLAREIAALPLAADDRAALADRRAAADLARWSAGTEPNENAAPRGGVSIP